MFTVDASVDESARPKRLKRTRGKSAADVCTAT